MKRTTLLVSFLGIVLVACAVSPTGRRQLMLVSEGQAIAASREAYISQMADLRSGNKLVTDPVVLRRIDTITGRLITHAIEMRPETRDWEWSVEVIDDPDTINAWCMAGGRMAIYTGLIQQLDATDDEIAQVMGHEIAHALANHTAERMSVAMVTNLGVTAVGILSDRPAVAMSAAAMAATVAIQLPNSRSSESEADRIGIELAAKAGYHPSAAVSLWQKMEAASGGGPPAFMSTHPSPEQRQAVLTALVPEMLPYYQQGGNRSIYPIQRVAAQ